MRNIRFIKQDSIISGKYYKFIEKYQMRKFLLLQLMVHELSDDMLVDTLYSLHADYM